VTGAVRAGIALWRADDLVTNGAPGTYPAALDAVAADTDCSSTAACFGTVLTSGVTDGSWHKTSGTVYTFTDGTSTFTYTYVPAAGTFISPTAP